MSDLNRVLLTGRLAADPELRYTQSGRAVVNFRVAVNRRWLNPDSGEWEEDADFIPVVAWGKQAEMCATYLQKGRLVAVDGRLRFRSFETQGGERRRIAEVNAQSVHFLGPKPQSTSDYEGQPEQDTESTPDLNSEEEVPF
ncbi:MAG: single-stranded DNA-binding protein [Candidatus Bipolaricaulaceae bacterium]